MNNINIFIQGNFKQHLINLNTIFRYFADTNYIFKAAKIYLEFQKLISLNKFMDKLGYSTNKEKLQTII